jgi:hypothetical protein
MELWFQGREPVMPHWHSLFAYQAPGAELGKKTFRARCGFARNEAVDFTISGFLNAFR